MRSTIHLVILAVLIPLLQSCVPLVVGASVGLSAGWGELVAVVANCAGVDAWLPAEEVEALPQAALLSSRPTRAQVYTRFQRLCMAWASSWLSRRQHISSVPPV